jgi:class 3 adenylate cyclase
MIGSQDQTLAVHVGAKPGERDAPSNFVGREREAGILRHAVDDAAAGRGRLVLLTGEAGIGKTRLAEETTTYAAANGMHVLWGRCWEGGGAPAFWPWIQVTRGSLATGAWSDAVRAELTPGLAYIEQIVPELRSALALPEPARERAVGLPLGDATLGPPPERFRLFDAVTCLFKGLARTAPLAMVLDDLHAADEDSLWLLRFLARELKQTRILIIATYREVEAKQSAQHATLLSEIGREGTTVPLRGLSRSEVADFIRCVAKLPVDDETVALLHQATDGNPFFLDEIVRLIVAERRLGHAERRGPGFTVPESVRAAVRRHIGRLADRTKSLLTIASVVGKEFDLALLREASGVPFEQVVDALGEAAANAVVIEPAEALGRYRFAHAIIAEALYADLGMSERAQLHQRIAAALEQLHGGDLTPHFAQLAYHYTQALFGGADKAVEYSRCGAERARNQLAFAEATRLYGMALRALAAASHADEAQRCEILLAMGESQAQGGSLEEARRAFEQAAEIARRLGHSGLLAQSALHASAWFGTFFTIDHALTALVEEAFAAAGDADSAVRASLMARLAGERYWAGDRHGGQALCAEAVAMARRVGDRPALVAALWIQSQISWGPEDVEGRLASATEIASLAESIGDYQRALRAHEMRFTALLETGDMQGLDAEARAYQTLAQKAGEQFGIVERFHAAVALLRGDFEQAERQIQELFGHAQRRQDPALLSCAQALLGALWEEQGRFDPAQFELAAKALMAESPALTAFYRILLAQIYVASGRRAEATAELESLAQHDFAAVPRDWNWLDNMRGLSMLCCALRDVARAATVYERLLPYASRNITAGWGDVARGSAALYLGSLARMLGRFDQAQVHFEQALQLNQCMGARPSVARTQFEYAQMLLERGRADDREKALGLLGESLATASALGMNSLEMRVRDLLTQASGEVGVRTVAQADAGVIDTLAAAAVAHPDVLHAHAAPDGTVTILFSDMEESSALFDKLGDLRAQEIVSAHNVIIREQVARQKGFEVKSTGDGFMVAFSSARRALLCAIGIQRAFVAYCKDHRDAPIRVRVGLHVGEPIRLSADFFGKSVIVAARIASRARGGEILVSSTLRDLAEGAGDLRFEEAGEVPLRGLSGTYRLFRVCW